MATLEEALAIALDLHTTGRMEEAEVLYGRILDAVPDEPNALHLYGLLCAQGGRLDQAAGLLEKAVALRPGLAEYRANLAMLHQARGNPAAAAEEYRSALTLCPDSAALAFPLAGTARQAGHSGLAMAAYRRTTLIQPDLAEPMVQAGILLRCEGRTAEAVAALRRAVRLRPDHGEAWHHLGVALQRMKDPEAVAALEHAAALMPEDGTARLNLGRARFEAGRWHAAAMALRSALALDPAADALELLAAALRKAGREDEAVVALRRALRLRPDTPNGWHALSLAESGDLRSLHRALALQPDHRNALSGLANRLRDRQEIAASLRLHDRAVRLQPASAEARWNRSLARLLAGDLTGGWEDYEARWGVADFPTKPRGLPQPLWTGQNIAGQTILLHEEQGRGDAIQFVRYAPLVAARGARVLLEVGGDLVPLFRGLPGVERVFARGEALPAFDWQCPLLSLPRAFGTRLETVPAAVPYLTADPARVAAWRGRLLAGDGLKIGLVWAGNPHFAGDRERSPGLAALAPLLEVPGCRFFGLQLGPGHDELARRALPPSFTDLAPEIRDFADTAAIMASLDLVVSSCTAPAHLAGALGVPLWVLLSHAPDWRWLLDRADSPWYPTARLFRQPRPGDWAAVAEEVATALAERAAAHS